MEKEILKAQISALEKCGDLFNKELEEKKKELAELQSAEKSPAEAWHSKQGFPKIDHSFFTEKDIVTLKFSEFCSAMKHDRIKAHEAGQAHATAEIHEIYKPLIERAKNAVIALRECKPMHVDGQLLSETLKNLKLILKVLINTN